MNIRIQEMKNGCGDVCANVWKKLPTGESVDSRRNHEHFQTIAIRRFRTMYEAEVAAVAADYVPAVAGGTSPQIVGET